jgi:BirA family biotin operon repressor/biotin-[acetyl-CoA-carboxylase] ligase
MFLPPNSAILCTSAALGVSGRLAYSILRRGCFILWEPVMPQPLQADQIRHQLLVRRAGCRIRVLPETTSTNNEALSAADDPANDGLAIFAEYQSAGRGRLGRPWLAPRGASVLCSLLLFEPDHPARQGQLVLIAGIAVCEAVAAVCADLVPTIRWPNDVLAAGRKLAGILAESRQVPTGRAVVVGIGINCFQTPHHFPHDLRDQATSLQIASAHPVSRLELARRLLLELDAWLGPPHPPTDQQLCQRWLDHAEPMGQRVRLQHAGRTYLGRTIQIDPSGGLTVELEPGGRRIFDPATTALLPGA